MPLIPLGRLVLIEPSPEEEKVTSAGIILQTGQSETFKKGTVVAVSKDIESSLTPGQTVMYGMGAGTEVDYDGRKVLSMKEDAVAFIVD